MTVLKSDADIQMARKLNTCGFDCQYGVNQFNHQLLIFAHIETFDQLQTAFAKLNADLAKREKLESLKHERLNGLR